MHSSVPARECSAVIGAIAERFIRLPPDLRRGRSANVISLLMCRQIIPLMNVQSGFSAYFPNRHPTWTEVIIAVLFAGSVAPDFLLLSTISWPAVAVGFVVFAVAVGPATNTSLGKRIGQWFRDIGISGRATAIILFLIAVVLLYQLDWVPNTFISDAASGGILAFIVYMVAYVVWAGEVSGWKA
jgi:hypothetical protein